MIEKMQLGQAVPRLSREECMDVMFSVLNDAELHMKASQG